MLNVEASPSVYSDTWSGASAPCHRPAVKKMMRVMVNVGIVVYIIYRMCSKRSVPVTDEASMVVSLKGDILSPK